MTENVHGQLRLDGTELTPEEILANTAATAVRVDVTGDFSEWFASHEAWPDGEPEGVWTAETFAAELAEQYSSAEHAVRDMDLEMDFTITVTDDQGRVARVVFKP